MADAQGGIPPEQQAQEQQAPDRKKKRGYAGQAFEIGSGANAALPGAAQGGAQPPDNAQNAAPQYGGYSQQPQQGYPQQAYGQPQHPSGDPNAQSGQPAYGQPGYATPQPGYAPPGQGYPAPAGPAAITEKMGQMNFGNQPQTNNQGPALQLNRLQTSDLISQPIHVSEIDQPAPSIVLPPNVSI